MIFYVEKDTKYADHDWHVFMDVDYLGHKRLAMIGFDDEISALKEANRLSIMVANGAEFIDILGEF